MYLPLGKKESQERKKLLYYCILFFITVILFYTITKEPKLNILISTNLDIKRVASRAHIHGLIGVVILVVNVVDFGFSGLVSKPSSGRRVVFLGKPLSQCLSSPLVNK